MTKGLQLWPGDRMHTFYRRHILRQTALDRASAERLAEALTTATNRMLVWDMPEEPAPAAQTTPEAHAKGKPTLPKQDKAKPSKPDAAGAAAKAPPVKAAPGKPDGPKPEPAKTEAAFDPYAFSAMVVLTKQGRDGLAARLAEIKSLDHLKKFADAQHLGLDRSLTKIDDVRKALLAAAEQRLADRRAAAS